MFPGLTPHHSGAEYLLHSHKRATMIIPRVRLAGLLGAMVICGCGDSNSPDHTGEPAVPVSLGDTVVAALSGAETDSFTLTPTSSGYAVVFLQALDTNVVELGIDNPDSVLSEKIVRASYAGHPNFAANRTGLYRLIAGTRYRIRVKTPDGIAGPYRHGDYRFHIHAIDPNPEDGPSTLAPGSQVVESFAGSGDFDHWSLSSAFADTLGLLFRFALQGPALNTQVSVNVYGFDPLNGANGYYHLTSPGDTVTQASGLILPPELTTLEIEVKTSDPGNYSYLDPVLPSYTISTTLVDLRPEQRPVVGGLLDTLITESIDSLGDVDTYRILPEDTAATYIIALLAEQTSPGDTIELRLSNAFIINQPPILRSTAGDSALLDHVTDTFYQWTPTTPFTITVRAIHLGQPTNHPTYRFGVMVWNTLPETAPGTISVGDTVTSEVIEYTGDVDEYTFTGTAGQIVTADLEMSAAFGGIGRLDITGLGTTLPNAGAPLGTTPLTVTIPSTGTYHVTVTNYTPGRGAYRLILK